MARRTATPAEPAEWQEGTDAARAARAVISQQFGELLLEQDMTGSRDHFALRLRELGTAERTRDILVVRAAVMEVCVSAGGWAAALDLGQRQQVSAAA